MRAAFAFLVASTFTALAWLLPGFDVAYGGEGMHIALEAIEATVCLVVGGIAWARFARSRRLDDAAVALAIGVAMVVESAFFLALPTLLNFEQIRPFSVWSSAGTSVVPGLLLWGGALAGGRRVGIRSAIALVAGVLLLLATTAGIVLGSEGSLPLAIDPALSPVTGAHPFAGVTAVVALQAAAGTLLLLAAATFVRRRRSAGPLFGWLAPALVVAGLASLNYALFPSRYSYWVYSGDILRLGFCVLLTCGIVVELRAAARRTIEMAVLEERRRLARDLHDGIAQELAFIAAEIVDVPSNLHPSLPWIRSAAERGLFESRRAIAALTLPLDLPVTESIAAAASDITARAGTSLRLDLDDTVEVSPAEHEAILRVVREAATNSVRHGRATTISVTLDGSRHGVTRLEISDDGTGITAAAATGGFGLTSMRERIEATGGALRLESHPAGGTTVEACWRHDG